jgi:glycosyltransferase involved in cell wall biosynthesis
MRISFFLDQSHPTPGAPWTRISSFANPCVARGFEVDILGALSPKTWKGKGMKELNRMNILNLVFKVSSNNPVLFIFNCVVSSITSTILLVARRPKIAIVSLPNGDSGIGFFIACLVLKIKVIVDCRDEWEDQLIGASAASISREFFRLIRRVSSLLYARAQLVTATTIPIARALAKRQVRNIALVPNGADCSVFRPLDRKPNKDFFEIIYSGGIGFYYRLEVVIEALRTLVDRGLSEIRLLIVGRGAIESVLRCAYQLGVRDEVAYLGNMSNSRELAKIIAEADVGIVPYDDNPLWKNTLPAKFFEYCACGLPVIATAYKDSILARLIHENEIGLTVNPMDVDGLADAIQMMSGDKEFRVHAGKRARILIEQHFNREKISEEFLNAVCKIVKC